MTEKLKTNSRQFCGDKLGVQDGSLNHKYNQLSHSQIHNLNLQMNGSLGLCKNYDVSVSAVIAIVSLQLGCKMKIASGDIFLKVRCGNCGERWR